ncbi:MAG: hydroxypyruvate isomerase, partial [Planctomycetaceae bacterium]|nr:hydroxypyruvate isomerase [Planctomycetaceae bacterium]
MIKKGRIKQSLVHWCYAPYWGIEQMIQVAKQLGCGSIELIEPKYFPLLKRHDLECAIGTIDMSPDPPFVRGFNNPKYHDQVIKATRDSIDACAEYGYKQVITFTGMAEGI